jgi:hypothetical protein
MTQFIFCKGLDENASKSMGTIFCNNGVVGMTGANCDGDVGVIPRSF